MLLEIKLLAFVKFLYPYCINLTQGVFLYPNSSLVFPGIIFTTNQQVKIISNFSIF